MANSRARMLPTRTRLALPMAFVVAAGLLGAMALVRSAVAAAPPVATLPLVTASHGQGEDGELSEPIIAQQCIPTPFLPCPPASNSGGCGGIQQWIDALPPDGGEVTISAGTFTCAAPLVVDRDRVTLRGSGARTVLRLADGANAPVLLLGQSSAVPSLTRRSLQVSNLVVDGNRAHQLAECWGGPCTANPIRNAGIVLRRVEDVLIEQVTVTGARAGGLVTEAGSRRVTVRDLTAVDNAGAGLASSETENSLFSGLQVHDNVQGAGLMFDRGFHHNLISDVLLTDNHTEGIAMQDARYNLFSGVQIRGSRGHGISLGQAPGNPTLAPSVNSFTGLVVVDSAGAGLRLNDPTIVEITVVAQFARNAGGCISTEGQAHVSGIVGCQP